MFPDLLRALALACAFAAFVGAVVALTRPYRLSAVARTVCGPWIRGNAQVCALLAAVFVVFAVAPVRAAEVVPLGPTQVAIPWGQWLADAAPVLVQIAGGALMLALSWVAAKLPAPIAAALNTSRTEQLLERAVSYGINAVAGAAHDKVLTVDVANKVVAEAANYAVRNGPAKLVDWLGGPAGIQERVVARLRNLDPAAAVTTGVALVAAPDAAPASALAASTAVPTGAVP